MERFEWDTRKAEINLRTHGISFNTAKRVFYAPFVLLRKEHKTNDEERALGLDGTSNEIAAKEGLAAIRNAGAQTVAFERTIEEIRGILHIYEEKLATNQGRLELYPGSMTSYIISRQLTSAGVKVAFFSVVDGWNAKSLGIRIEMVVSSYLRRKFM